jgi:hypothetical protein
MTFNTTKRASRPVYCEFDGGGSKRLVIKALRE